MKKLNRRQLRALLAEAAEGLINKPYDEYADQSIVDASVFENPKAIMENFLAIKERIEKIGEGFWRNDQLLQERIEQLEAEVEALKSGQS